MENDLISRSALLEKELLYVDELKGLDCILFIDPEDVKNAPAVDAVEVVRRKDCKFAYINSFSASAGVAVCKKLSNEAGTAIRNHDDFCSCGERRADDGE